MQNARTLFCLRPRVLFGRVLFAAAPPLAEMADPSTPQQQSTKNSAVAPGGAGQLRRYEPALACSRTSKERLLLRLPHWPAVSRLLFSLASAGNFIRHWASAGFAPSPHWPSAGSGQRANTCLRPGNGTADLGIALWWPGHRVCLTTALTGGTGWRLPGLVSLRMTIAVMAGALLAAASAVAAGAAAATLDPAVTPPLRLTPGQSAFMAGVAGRAPSASVAAEPRILAALDAPRFRHELARCCDAIADLQAKELLELLAGEIESAELTHNFEPQGSFNHSFYGDANLTGYTSLSFFVNNWQSPLLGLLSVETSRRANFAASAAELYLFGLKPFSEPSHTAQLEGWPRSLAEATERPVYTWLNAWKLDMSTQYGQVAVVFRSAAVSKGTFLSPTDSGGWEIGVSVKRMVERSLRLKIVSELGALDLAREQLEQLLRLKVGDSIAAPRQLMAEAWSIQRRKDTRLGSDGGRRRTASDARHEGRLPWCQSQRRRDGWVQRGSGGSRSDGGSGGEQCTRHPRDGHP
eukprot:COSAG06_NODE_3306_length_5529_cov_7.228913_2_plen_522_part_00